MFRMYCIIDKYLNLLLFEFIIWLMLLTHLRLSDFMVLGNIDVEFSYASWNWSSLTHVHAVILS